jgi:Methyltransferase domain
LAIFPAAAVKDFVSFYQQHIVPHLVKLALRNGELEAYRRGVLAGAEGRVLEAGIGAGPNPEFRPAGVREILPLELSAKLIAMAQRAAGKSSISVKFLAGSVEAIPLRRGSVDTVAMTWTLCCGVSKPGRCLLLVEHGQSPGAGVRKWQHRLSRYGSGWPEGAT